jgi:glycosyltransferase involved in cell wall biosynthesis
VFDDKVCIIICAKNEERSIGEIIEGCKKYSSDVLIIDGHSRDKTREVAQNLGAKVHLDTKKGKGAAIRLGIEKADKDILVFIDADGSHDPDEIPKLVKPILEGKTDLVVGSRLTGGSDELFEGIGTVLRMIGSAIITMGINYRFGAFITDSQNGFRAIRRDVGRALGLKENITTIEQEMTIKALRKGYRVAEIPSHEYSRKYGASKFNVYKVAFRYVYSWIKYMFFNHD